VKSLIMMVLISVLGFLGCGGSDNGSNSGTGQSIPFAPFGLTDTTTPTYEWTSVPGATRYCLLVEDTNYVPVVEEWYTAEEARCGNGEYSCYVTPDIEVAGTTWKVRAWAGVEWGLWSDELQFSYIGGGPPRPRFTDHGDDTVTDNHTKLMWTKSANLCPEPLDWWDASSCCEGLTIAGYSDWRLPSLPELASLVDRNEENPALPPGNPFTDLIWAGYWTATSDVPDDEDAWQVWFEWPIFCVYNKNYGYSAWCVRCGI